MNAQSPPNASEESVVLRNARALRLAALRGDRVTSDRLTQIGFPLPAGARQLADLAYEGQSVFLACHLSDSGLGDLEDIERRLIEREVEFALVEAGSTSIETYVKSGSAKIEWAWPKAAFVNAASISVEVYRQPDSSGNPPVQLVEPYTHETRRDPNEPNGSIECTLRNLHVDYEFRILLLMATRSESSGRVYTGYNKELAVVQVQGTPRPELGRRELPSTDSEDHEVVPELIVVDPTQSKRSRSVQFTDRAAVVAAAVLVLVLIVAAVWALVG